jgi:peptidoglycan/xylan/chitin deacetylase (PgdA/CDA1 family)/folate-dependent phosphoribosylglycinamide formyltransferase PurN
MHKIVVFTGDPSFAVRKGIVVIDEAIPCCKWLIVWHTAIEPVSHLVRNQWRNLKKNGWRWIPYQAGEILRTLSTRTTSGTREVAFDGPGGVYDLDRLLTRPNVQLLETRDLHSEAVLAQVRSFAPDLGLSLAAPILKAALFEIPRLGTINLHKGKVPDYRGMPPAFWELWNGEKEVGCTIHRVNSKLDKGDVVARTTLPVQAYSTVKGLQLQLDEVGVRLMCSATTRVLNEIGVFEPQPLAGRTYTKPTLREQALLARRLSTKLPNRSGFIRRFARTNFHAAALWFGHLMFALSSTKPTVTVLLYHRVTDALRDSLTTGVEQFDRQMALIRRHAHAISIEDVLTNRYPAKPSKPLVCVTFDDGYRDNANEAVPLLLRHKIPAAFFVSTGMVGSGRAFAHDIGKVPTQLTNMNWDELREMRRAGFVIGSHTVNHIDCAKEPQDVVDEELRASKEALIRELGIGEVILAYPFGGREHMTPERLESVKTAGYAGCLSAYGGFNRGSVNRWNVLRCGINWAFTDLAFRCRVVGIL